MPKKKKPIKINKDTTFNCSLQDYDFNKCDREEFFKRITEYEEKIIEKDEKLNDDKSESKKEFK